MLHSIFNVGLDFVIPSHFTSALNEIDLIPLVLEQFNLIYTSVAICSKPSLSFAISYHNQNHQLSEYKIEIYFYSNFSLSLHSHWSVYKVDTFAFILSFLFGCFFRCCRCVDWMSGMKLKRYFPLWICNLNPSKAHIFRKEDEHIHWANKA